MYTICIALGSAQSQMFLVQKAHLSNYSTSENCDMQVVKGQNKKTSVSVIESSLLCWHLSYLVGIRVKRHNSEEFAWKNLQDLDHGGVPASGRELGTR